MDSVKWFLLVLSILESTGAARILLFPYQPGFSSRLMNMVKLANILTELGHDPTIITNSIIGTQVKPNKAKVEVYKVPLSEEIILCNDTISVEQFKGMGKASPFYIYEQVDFYFRLNMPFCRRFLESGLMEKIKKEQYDLIITDSLSFCGKIMVDHLNLPAIAYSNWGFYLEHNLFYPNIPSFVCNAGSPSCSSDVMNFQERVGNLLTILIFENLIAPYIFSKLDSVRLEFGLNTSVPFEKSLIYRSPVIVNGEFVLDYPRPLMPHVIMLSGLFHKEAGDIPRDYAEFLASSEPYGIVVASFGSVLPNVDKDKAEIMASVFGRLRHKVLWRHTGEVPENLKDNTMLVDWFPQSDVLASPFTKLFITHCGVSSTYEAAYNAVPVVAIPVFIDQLYNARRLVDRGGMGTLIDFDTFTEEDFEKAVLQVLQNKTYADNARYISNLLKDQEMNPKEKFAYWVDFVIRHKGARHLISERAFQMSLFEFTSLDVLFFLMFILIAILSFVVILIYCVVNQLCKRMRVLKTKEE